MSSSDAPAERVAPVHSDVHAVLDAYYTSYVPGAPIERVEGYGAYSTREQVVSALLALEVRANRAGRPWQGARLRELAAAIGGGWSQSGFYDVLQGDHDGGRVIARTRDGRYRIPAMWRQDAIALLVD